MGCKTEPIDKKAFGISIYVALKEKYGYKNHYEVTEIKEVFEKIGYPNAWLCWAMIAFMLPANAGEYFRAIGKPVDIVEIKRKFIKEMTDGKLDRLNVPQHHEYRTVYASNEVSDYDDDCSLVEILDNFI